MFSLAYRFALSFLTITALLAVSAPARAQRLENFQSGPGQTRHCGGHSGSPGDREARLKATKQKKRASQLTVQPTVTSIRTVQQPEPPDVIATRQLNLARELSAEADLALQNKDSDRASKLRSRVSERLADLVEKFADTEAASKALALLEQERTKRSAP